MNQIVVKQYKNVKAYQIDSQRMAALGYAGDTPVSQQPRAGCVRVLMLGGIGALVFKPKPILIVTYRSKLATM